MSNTIQLKRTSLLDKRPTASGLTLGEPAVVLHQDSFGVYLKDGAGAVRKVGPIHVGTSAPNAAPIGSSGNSLGEGWLDTSSNAFKVWDGSNWSSIVGSGNSSEALIVDHGLEVGTVDYGSVASTPVSTEDWGVASYLRN